MDVFGFQVGSVEAPWAHAQTLTRRSSVRCSPNHVAIHGQRFTLDRTCRFPWRGARQKVGQLWFSSDPFHADSAPPMFVTTRGGSATCAGGVCPTCLVVVFMSFRHQQSPTPTAPVVEKFTAAPVVTHALPVPVFE